MDNLNYGSYGIKSQEQLQAEKNQPDISMDNNARLGAALLGTSALGGLGYVGYNALNNVGNITAEGVGNVVGTGAGNIVDVGSTVVGAGVDTIMDVGQAGASLPNVLGTIKDFGTGTIEGFRNSNINEGTLISSSKKLSFIQENTKSLEELDLNAIKDKAKANAGLLIGGLGAAGIGSAAMMGEVPDNYEELARAGLSTPTPGAVVLGTGIMGAAGAGVGHVIHNKIKENNVNMAPVGNAVTPNSNFNYNF